MSNKRQLHVSEQWKPIPGWPEYEVSDLGRVRNSDTKAIRKTTANRYGYERLTIWRRGVQKNIYVHRAVAAAFIGKSGLPVNHKDTDKLNNRFGNLEYTTSGENKRHAQRLGLVARGESVNTAKLSAADVRAIRRIDSTVRNGTLARRYGVTDVAISKIRTGETWSHLGGRKNKKRRGFYKLSVTDVRAIRALRGKMPQREIADRYGVQQTTVSAIQLRRTWLGA